MPASGDTNRLTITDSNDGSTSDYSWQTNGWLLSTGGGLRKELRISGLSATNTINTTTNTISDLSGPPVQSKVEVWQTMAAGPRLVTEIFGTGTASRTNTYTYTAAGYIEQSIRWDGYWEYYFYDSHNRPTNILSAFLNQSITTNRSLCRLLEYDYSTNVISGAGDNGNTYAGTPRRTIESVLGTEISRKYFVTTNGMKSEIQCTATGAAWNDSHNLVTTYLLFTNGFYLNEPQVTIHPDGTGHVIQYGAIGTTRTNIEWDGHLDATLTNVDNGVKTATVINTNGHAISKTIVDVISGITISRETYSYDGLNRLTNTAYLDGTSSGVTYDCCNKTSDTDRDGTVISYGYDGLKRLTTTTVNSITISNTLDAAGNVLSTTRYGTDGTAIVLSQSTYDDGGQMTSTTSALGATTSYTTTFDGSGQMIKTSTYADGGTRIETYYRDGTLQGISGTAVHPTSYLCGADGDGAYTTEIRLDANGGTNEWTKTSSDASGRRYKTLYAAASGNPNSLAYYNSAGQTTNQIDPDGVSTIYIYNAKGEQTHTIVDMNQDHVIDFSGGDRITFVTNDVIADNGTNVRRTRAYAWSTSADASTLLSTAETSVDGLQSWNVTWNSGIGLTNRSRTVYDPANGYRIVTNTAPDGSYSVTTNQNGRLNSVTSRDSLGNQLSAIGYSYDAHGRQSGTTDARNGTTSYYFNNADQVSSTVTPVPATGQSAQVTTNFFDSMGRVLATKLPDNTFVTNKYDLIGQLTNTFGSRTYPVSYTFDAQGRMKTMTTWQNYSGNSGAATTTWSYDQYRGFLTGKTYDGGAAGPAYTYTAAGRPATRLWARGITTTYSYNNAGDLSAIGYSDSTPAVGYSFDRRGRQTTITNGTTICSHALDDAGILLSESYSGGPLDGLTITNSLDQLSRRTNLSLLSPLSALLSSTAYSYDAASRLHAVASGTNSAAYSYVANSPLVSQIAFTNGSVQRMVTTKSYDYLNRLTSISSVPSVGSAVSFNYSYNSANQRTSVTNAENARWVYTYDSLGQVISGKKYWSDGTPVAGQQLEYNFDDIGNRKSTASGGNNSGTFLRTALYTNNTLNQITSREVPGYENILGTANSNATVLAWAGTNSYALAERKGDYFHAELPVNNSSAALWLSITNIAALKSGTNDIVGTNAGNAFIPKTAEVFGYDLDGNTTNDGRWSFTWDGENRLLSMESHTDAPAASKLHLDFGYDYQGRRIQKIVSTNNGSGYFPLYTNRFAYDGWNLLATLSPASSLLSTYVWGADLSGSMQGAGGAGGLLFIGDFASTTGDYAVVFDGNGNVASLITATSGTTSAQYEYGPFGEPRRATGSIATRNPLLFSTKFYDWETGFNYYGYRYYNPSAGRWICRDPLEELGGLVLYGCLRNNPVNEIDKDGRFGIPGAIVGALVDLTVQISINVATGKDWSDINVSSVIISAGVGFIAPGGLGTAMKTFKGIRAAGQVSTKISKASKYLALRKNPESIAKATRKIERLAQNRSKILKGIAEEIGIQTAWQTIKHLLKNDIDEIEKDIKEMKGTCNDGYTITASDVQKEVGFSPQWGGSHYEDYARLEYTEGGPVIIYPQSGYTPID